MAEHSALLRVDLEVCPSCGEFGELNEVTGWCSTCTASEAPLEPRKCNSCGRPFSYPTSNKYKRRCNRCIDREFREKHSERIAELRALGHTSEDAIRIARRETVPNCMVCGDAMPNASRGRAFFCKTKPACKTARNKLKWLTQRKGIPHEEALAQVLEQMVPLREVR